MENEPIKNSGNYPDTSRLGSDSIIVVYPWQKVNDTHLRLSSIIVNLGRTQQFCYNNPGPVFINPDRSTITITLPGQSPQETTFATFKQNKSRVRLIFDQLKH